MFQNKKVPGIPHCRSADHDITSTRSWHGGMAVILASTRRPSPAASASELRCNVFAHTTKMEKIEKTKNSKFWLGGPA